MKESHIAPTGMQSSHEQAASKDRNQFASSNHGHPATTSMNRAGGSKFGQQGHAPSAVPATPHQQAASPNHAAGNNGVHREGHISNATPMTHPSVPNNQPNGGNHSQPQQHTQVPQQHSAPQPQQHSAPQQHEPAQHQAPHAGGGGEHRPQ